MPDIIDLITSTLTGGRNDPFPTFKFHVEVGGIMEAAFTECSGLEMSTEVYEYAEGGLNDFVHKFPGRTKHSNVTLKKGFALSNGLFKWYQEMADCMRQGKKFTYRPVTIILYTTVQQGKLMRWNLDQAFPVRWVGPTFKTDEIAVAVETLEFAHHGIQVLEK